MKYMRTIRIHAPVNAVFAFMDNIRHTGMHMTNPSGAMMGNKLQLEQLSPNESGPGSSYRWHGSMMGLTLDFTVVTTKWIQDREKIWETRGEAKMIILSWYSMKLLLMPIRGETNAELSIEYALPKSLFPRLLGLILAPIYARWCVNQMLNDSKRALASPSVSV